MYLATTRDDVVPEGSNYERINLQGEWGERRGREEGVGGEGGTYDGKRLSDPAIFFN